MSLFAQLRLLVVVAALTVGSLGVVHGWGPISHYDFTCSAVRSSTTAASCMADRANDELLRGTDLPDAFFFGSFVSGSPCTTFAALHNIIFSGYQLQFAMQQQKQHNTAATFNAVEYALGFGAHVVGDAAGFYPGGYLGSGHVPTSVGRVNWVSVWPEMTLVDAYVLSNTTKDQSVLVKAPLSQEGANFIANATAYYAKSGVAPKDFPVMSGKQVFQCTTAWSDVVNRNTVVSGTYSATTLEHLLQFYDNYGATSFQDAVQHFDMARGCAILIIETWVHEMMVAKATPLAAANAVIAQLEKLVEAGKCNVQPTR